MKRKVYEAELRKLQVRLCRLQEWVKVKGLRVIVVFEGRDAAGKDAMLNQQTFFNKIEYCRRVATRYTLRSSSFYRSGYGRALMGPRPNR